MVPGVVTVEVEWALEAGKTYHIVHPEPFRSAHPESTLCGTVDAAAVYPHSSDHMTVPEGILHRFEGVSWTTLGWWASFWNLTTEPGLTLFTDEDEDGVPLDDDCDDTDSALGHVMADMDCDGALTADDCDDADASSTIIAEDADCDGTLTADDCDDADPSSTVMADDMDCDGALTADDCDDADASSTIIAEDADCDGTPTDEDCDDADGNCRRGLDGDLRDGTPTDDDCDDADAGSTVIAEDAGRPPPRTAMTTIQAQRASQTTRTVTAS